ncbi:outer envelope pore protein 16-3, chloroplastic/mitochondrial [Cryptomeria japonica]|uniref:outer envelope pore protein 16-3, chloroplastic/mitochondrial n=1 Tax=Cryptomeria japonica TaxID=3369 RepID=UPI0025AC678F|nr:outer envelope pore protein 16-3, chloroplastic/mitochondrial [Cryptomeria japonica]
MDQRDRTFDDKEKSLEFKTFAGTMSGGVAGSIWGAVVASWHDVPKVERNVALPGLQRTLHLMGNYGLTFAAIGGIFAFSDHVAQRFRGKQDFWNGAIGGFVAGASVLGLRGRSISSALKAGAALAATAALVDASGQTTRIDNGTEYYPYTTGKAPESAAVD